MRFQTRNREDVQLDMTPLVDVVFLLLIFFMLSTSLSVNPGIKIDLPKSSAEQVTKKKTTLRVAIEAGGSIYLEGKKLTFNQLYEKFQVVGKAQGDEALVVIEADKKVYHGLVVKVMDAAKSSGLNKLAIATQPNDVSE
ncbi:MAG: biopolymer transporter ExbD [Deltaproteobacteria bacterium]|nr:biopolymer transporter ExbD [Deltaproteobacteria bacterium]